MSHVKTTHDQYRTVEFAGIVTALSSIHHGGGQSLGINAKLRREKFVQPDGTVEEIPVISGNSIRGVLRDIGMYHMCRMLGYGDPGPEGKPLGLSLPAYYFLFSGGALTQDASRGLDIDLARQLAQAIPLVAVFGGAMGNQIMPGKLKVDKLLPICLETAHLLPPSSYRDVALLSIWEYLQEEMYTRTDDEKDERKRTLIAQEVRALLETHARDKRRQSPVQPVVQEDTGQKQQMLYYVESFAAGTRFYWAIVLDQVTDLELDAFAVTLAQFSRTPYIGGKSNVGHGKISVQFDNWHTIDSRVAATGAALDAPLGTRYQKHLEQHGPSMRELLERLG
jgi:CRISPR type IV-associated protein Csf2